MVAVERDQRKHLLAAHRIVLQKVNEVVLPKLGGVIVDTAPNYDEVPILLRPRVTVAELLLQAETSLVLEEGTPTQGEQTPTCTQEGPILDAGVPSSMQEGDGALLKEDSEPGMGMVSGEEPTTSTSGLGDDQGGSAT